MKKHLLLSLHYIKLSVMSRVAYKGDFIAWTLVTFGWIAFTFIFYELLFANIDSIAGWSKGQIFVLQGFVFLAESIVWGFFYFALKFIPDQIAYGEIDKLIVKPINTQYALSFRGFGIQHLTSFITGLITIQYGLHLANISPSAVKVLIAILIFVIGTVILYSLYFLSICLTFWFDKLSNVVYLIPNSLDLAKVPLNAYGGWTKLLVTYIIPIVLSTSLPSTILFGQPNWTLLLYTFIFAGFILSVSRLVLSAGLKRYSGASS